MMRGFPMSKQNPFIVIESIDGAGGSTQADLLAKAAKKNGAKVRQYHFPQEDSATGRVVYGKFLDIKNKLSLSNRERALLYIQDFYSRADEMHQLQNSSTKNFILTDRYYTSTLAYQSVGLSGKKRSERIEWLKDLCERGAPRLLKPTKVIFLDTPVDISMKHLKKGVRDFYENKRKQIRIRNSYLRLATEEKWHIINSVDDAGEQRSIKDIHQEIWSVAQKLF